LLCTCAKVRELSDLQFGLVRGVGRGIGVLDGGPRHARGRGGFWGFCSPIFTIGNSHCAAASRLLGHFLQLHGAGASASHAGLARGVASRCSNAALLPHHCGQSCSDVQSVHNLKFCTKRSLYACLLCLGLYSPLWALVGFVIIIFLIYWLVTAFELSI